MPSPAEWCPSCLMSLGKLAALVGVSMLEQQIAFHLHVGWDPVDLQHHSQYQSAHPHLHLL